MSEIAKNTHFDVLDDATKETLLLNRKAVSTNRAKKQWIKCRNDYIEEKQLGPLSDVRLKIYPRYWETLIFLLEKRKFLTKVYQLKITTKIDCHITKQFPQIWSGCS